MATTFRENDRMQASANALQRVVMTLSNTNYIVLGASIKRESIFSIQLDRPYEGPAAAHKTQKHEDKTIGSCEAFGCRLYWQVQAGEVQA